MDEEKLRSYIRRALLEDKPTQTKKPEDSKKPKDSKKPEDSKKAKSAKSDTKAGEIGVSEGRGRWSKEVQEAGALAKDDPDRLMKNLGIDKKASGYNGMIDIIKQALVGSDVMKRSYSAASLVKQGDMSGVKIAMGELDSRNGAKYIHHTLIGARNAGKLTLDIPLQIDRLDDSSVIVYVSPKKNAWKKPANNSTK